MRYRTIERLSGSFVCGETFERVSAKGLEERVAMRETFRVRERKRTLHVIRRRLARFVR